MAILLFLNIKGGVAKTTSSVAVAEALADAGGSVLVIDADHQCAASALLLGEERLLQAERRRRTLQDLLVAMLEPDFEGAAAAGWVQPEASSVAPLALRVAALPASFRLEAIAGVLAERGVEGRAAWRASRTRLRHWLRRSFDHVVVDCPPSLAPQVRLFLGVADAYVIPCIPDPISVRGAVWLQQRLERLRPRCPALGLAWTLFRQQNLRQLEVIEELGRRAGRPGPWALLPRPFATAIPNSVDMVRATEPDLSHRSLNAKYTPSFARLYAELADEIVGRLRRIRRAAQKAAQARRTEGV